MDPVVVDVGTAYTRVGFAGEDEPRYTIPSLIGKNKNPSNMGQKDFYVGDEVFSYRDLLVEVQSPLRDSKVANWDDIDRLFSHLYYIELRIAPEEQSVLVSHSVSQTYVERFKLASLLYETYDVPSLTFVPQPVLALMGSKRSTGIVIDCGESHTTITPIVDNKVVRNAIESVPCNGITIRDVIKNYHPNVPDLDLRKIAETQCRVTIDPDQESVSSDFTLGDGSSIKLGNELLAAPDLLFSSGIVNKLESSYERCHGNDSMWANVVVCGGISVIPGFLNKLKFKTESSKNGAPSIVDMDDKQRKELIWLGGASLAAQSDFEDISVTREEFEENGVSMFTKKNNFWH
jgi:actin-related protein